MNKIISKKEFTSQFRDKRFKIVGGIIVFMLTVALLGGFNSYEVVKKERLAAQKEARETWLNQGEKNPHSAAHYGSFAFRPKSALSFFDFGVDSYVGTNVYLEAHRQNDPKFSGAQDSTSLIRFGEMSVAFVLQLLVPLLIIFLCFNSISQEKEDSTLKLVLSQGITLSQLAWGKIMGHLIALSIILVPCLILIFSLIVIGSDGALSKDIILRFSIILLGYLIYFFLFISISTVVSARAKSSRNALVTLLGIWIFACIILPKATINIGSVIYKAPSSFEFREAIQKDEANGIDGHNASDKRFEELKQKVLSQYQVDSLQDLPVNFDAITMQEGEKYSSMVYNTHFDRLEQIYQNQNSVAAFSSFINPFMAIRNLSMGLSGSDYKSALAFQKYAESYRFSLVEKLNTHMRDFSKTGDWEKKADASLYGQIPDFAFTNYPVPTVLLQNWIGIIALLIWVFLCINMVNKLENRTIS